MNFRALSTLQCYITGFERISTFRKNHAIDNVIAHRPGIRRCPRHHVLSDIRKKLLLKKSSPTHTSGTKCNQWKRLPMLSPLPQDGV